MVIRRSAEDTENSQNWSGQMLRLGSKDRVGVVVIGRNEGQRLQRCLNSLETFDHVVYADSASTDDSVAIALKNGVAITVLDPSETLTAARGRNAGVQSLANTQVEFIQFIDGDCELVGGWVEAAVEWLDNNPSTAAVCGRRRERFPEASLYNKLADREWATPVGRTESTGGDSLVRLEAFRSVDGFRDDQLAHEEPEFCARLRSRGWEIYRIDKEMTIHDAATFHLAQFYKRSRRAGLGMMQAVLRNNPVKDRASYLILRRAFIWSAVLPLLIAASAFVDWRLSAILAAIYPVQWIRLFIREFRSGAFSFREAAGVATLSLVGKFAEADGGLRMLVRHALA